MALRYRVHVGQNCKLRGRSFKDKDRAVAFAKEAFAFTHHISDYDRVSVHYGRLTIGYVDLTGWHAWGSKEWGAGR